MIISRIRGGLGNQMFQYAIARSMALRNNDVFKLDTSFYAQQSLRNYDLGKFSIMEAIASAQEIRRLRGRHETLRRAALSLGVTLPRPRSYKAEKQITIFDEDIYRSSGDVYLDGFWQNESYFKEVRDVIIQDFSAREGISREAEKYKKSMEHCIGVSLHVRRGDYVFNTHTNSIHGLCSLDYYHQATEYMTSVLDGSVKFYVFSDDIPWCSQNLDFIENRVLVNDTMSSVDDLMLMKTCQHNIIANSSFSWWGAWLNDNPDKIVISPSAWVVLNPEGLTWVPSDWLQF